MAGILQYVPGVSNFAPVNKAWKYLAAVLFLLLSLAGTAAGQNHVRRAMDRARVQRESMAAREILSEMGAGKSGYMAYKVEDGDTVYFDTIDPVWIFGYGKHKRKNWREYYRLVYNFAKVYPYAEASGRLQELVDSTIAANQMNRFQKDRYMTQVQTRLFKNFEGSIRNMTISQGALMLKLIDRETGQSSYSIIKDYKNGIAAGFWQGIAKLFDNDLKAEYDPKGADKNIEELVQAWKDGTFRKIYWSIFWEDPPVVEVPDIEAITQ